MTILKHFQAPQTVLQIADQQRRAQAGCNNKNKRRRDQNHFDPSTVTPADIDAVRKKSAAEHKPKRCPEIARCPAYNSGNYRSENACGRIMSFIDRHSGSSPQRQRRWTAREIL